MSTSLPLDLGGPVAEPVVEGERKLVTALFADIKGSVELMVELDAEDARAIVDPALRLMVDVVRAHEGYVVRSTGDGIYALFGAPIAYQDHPRRGVYAALAMQTALRGYAERLEQQNKRPITVRVGINTGEVVVRVLDTGARLEYGGIGHTINLAARLQTLASPGSIVIGEHTRKLVEGYFELRPMPPMLIKGVSDPIIAYEVAGLGALRRPLQIAMRRGLSKFVGRDNEIRVLRCALDRAMNGEGRIVGTVTEAGTGKSRLIYEFVRTLPDTCKVLDAYAVAHGKGMPWMPVIDFLHGYFDIRPADEAATRRSKIEAALAAIGPLPLDVAPYLFGLLGVTEGIDPLSQMDPRVRRARLIDMVREIILAESRRHPLVLIFEDLHWADAQTRLLLDALAEGIAGARILMLSTFRPEHEHSWMGKDYYIEIRLEPLSAEFATELLASLLPEADELGSLKRSIIDKTAGNPFFIEEISNSLYEDGTLVQGGATRITKPLNQLRLPQTVQDTLSERIDKLPAGHKDLLQILAVIGTRVPMDLILGVCERMRIRPHGVLADLQNADFIYAQPDGRSEMYFFKHAFTQEVAYGTLLSERRKRLHERVAETMEAIYVEKLAEQITQLAHHYSRGGNALKAIQYLGQAGEVAVQRSAHTEAAENLKAAIRLVETLPEGVERATRESRLWLALGVSLQTSLGYAAPEVGAAYERAWQLAERTGDRRQLVSAIRGHSIFSIVRADYKTAFSLGARLADLDDERQEHVAERLMILGLASMYTGQFRSGERYFLEALALENENANLETIQYSGHSRALCLSYLALNMWYLGYPDRALHYSKDAVALAQALSIPITLAQAMGMYGLVNQTKGDFAVAEEWMDKTISYAGEQGFPYWYTLASMLKGAMLARRGGAADGVAMFETNLRNYRDSGAKIGLPWFIGLRGEMLRDAGQIQEAIRSIDESLWIMQETNERYHEADFHRLKGEMLLMQDAPGASDVAEAHFQLSLAVARSQAAKSMELRAAASLARLRSRQGRFRDGLELLAPVYQWFSEGRESPDLQDARLLLEELAAAASLARAPRDQTQPAAAPS